MNTYNVMLSIIVISLTVIFSSLVNFTSGKVRCYRCKPPDSLDWSRLLAISITIIIRVLMLYGPMRIEVTDYMVAKKLVPKFPTYYILVVSRPFVFIVFYIQFIHSCLYFYSSIELNQLWALAHIESNR